MVLVWGGREGGGECMSEKLASVQVKHSWGTVSVKGGVGSCKISELTKVTRQFRP